MKKSILIIAALFAAVAMNAKEIVIDLSKGVAYSSTQTVMGNVAYADDVLIVNWQASAGWQHHGVAFALDNIENVTNITFDYKGDGVAAYGDDGVCFYPYLRDAEGKRWFKSDYYPNVQNTEWQAEEFLPDNCPYDGATYQLGEQPFTSLEFIVDPSKEGQGVFYLRNVKLTVPDDETALNNVTSQSKTTKVIRGGQVLFIRDGKTFNALGAIVAE